MTNPIDTMKPSYDAVIVGGRCAGAATAMLLARAGLDVLVVEQAAAGADTLSTLAIMRAGVLQLSRWGLLDAVKAAGTPPIRKTTFFYGDHVLDIAIQPRDGVDALYAPRRTVLDTLLAQAALRAGADVVYRARVDGVLRDRRGRVSGVAVENGGVARRIAARIVIGADGVNSTIARTVGAEPYRFGRHVGAVIYARAKGVDADGYQWRYSPGASVGLIPTNNEETLVFAATTQQRFMSGLRFDLAQAFQEILRDSAPTLEASITRAELTPYRAFAGHAGMFRPAWGQGWALVGDAGYFKDPITAHGITDALRDAELLARAVARGTDAALAEYQRIRDGLSIQLFSITDEIASFAWDMSRLQALHRSLSDEMGREVKYVVQSWNESEPDGEDHGGARAALQPDHWRLQSAAR
jgi:flavin-dependent dehydrogenase